MLGMALGVLLNLYSAAWADWLASTGAEVAPNFAEISVLENRVLVDLEVDPADFLSFFPDAVPPSNGAQTLELPSPEGLRVALSVGTEHAPMLDGKIKLLEPRKRKPRPVAGRYRGSASQRAQPLSEKVIFARIEFRWSKRPDAVTLAPPMDASGRAQVTLGFLLRHKSVPVTDYRYLAQAERLSLDWSDPWFSTFENPNLTRHHKSPIMGFLRMEPREIRQEVIFRLRDLEKWTGLDLGVDTTLDDGAFERIREAGRRVLTRQSRLLVDGSQVEPTSISIHPLDIGVTGISVLESAKGMERETALLGAVLSYPQPDLPKNVVLSWDLFPDGVDIIPVSVADPAGAVPSQSFRGDRDVEWINFLKDWSNPSTQTIPITIRVLTIPFVSLALIGLSLAFAILALLRPRRRLLNAGGALLLVLFAYLTLPIASVRLPIQHVTTLNDDTAVKVVGRTIDNSATAMLEVDGERFTAALKPFVPGSDLDAVGTEIRRGLSVVLPSGARAQIRATKDLRIESVTQGKTSQQVLATWTSLVDGGHFGHQHQRLIRYRGLFDLKAHDGAWHLVGLTILSGDTVS